MYDMDYIAMAPCSIYCRTILLKCIKVSHVGCHSMYICRADSEEYIEVIGMSKREVRALGQAIERPRPKKAAAENSLEP